MNYIKRELERTDPILFFQTLAAEQVNYSTLAESAEISQPTAKEWLKVLSGLGVVYLLAPYANNELKRLTKTPKLYF